MRYEQQEGSQSVTIRLPDCPGQSIFGLGNHDLQESCPTGQVQIINKLNTYYTSCEHQKSCPY